APGVSSTRPWRSHPRFESVVSIAVRGPGAAPRSNLVVRYGRGSAGSVAGGVGPALAEGAEPRPDAGAGPAGLRLPGGLRCRGGPQGAAPGPLGQRAAPGRRLGRSGGGSRGLLLRGGRGGGGRRRGSLRHRRFHGGGLRLGGPRRGLRYRRPRGGRGGRRRSGAGGGPLRGRGTGRAAGGRGGPPRGG